MVLDLRQCAVGEPEDGIALADLFLEKGLLTYLEGQRWARRDFKAEPAKVVWKLPVVVLTNRGTADGAEIAAAALEENNRAKGVGERTYGDASMRRALTMDDGSAIILSVAKYYSPSGKAIQDTGVTPNEAVQEPEPQLETDEDGETAHPEADRNRAEARRRSDPEARHRSSVEIAGDAIRPPSTTVISRKITFGAPLVTSCHRRRCVRPQLPPKSIYFQ